MTWNKHMVKQKSWLLHSISSHTNTSRDWLINNELFPLNIKVKQDWNFDLSQICRNNIHTHTKQIWNLQLCWRYSSFAQVSALYIWLFQPWWTWNEIIFHAAIFASLIDLSGWAFYLVNYLIIFPHGLRFEYCQNCRSPSCRNAIELAYGYLDTNCVWM
jgi:hypothetical protein